MEKKTKLTITLALAVLVITLSLGTAISMAPNENGAQIAAPIQPEIEVAPQVNEISIQSSTHATVTGSIHLTNPALEQNIYTWVSGGSHPEVVVTVTNSFGPGAMAVIVDGTHVVTDYSGQGTTFYGKLKYLSVHNFDTAQPVTGSYEITVM